MMVVVVMMMMMMMVVEVMMMMIMSPWRWNVRNFRDDVSLGFWFSL